MLTNYLITGLSIIILGFISLFCCYKYKKQRLLNDGLNPNNIIYITFIIIGIGIFILISAFTVDSLPCIPQNCIPQKCIPQKCIPCCDPPCPPSPIIPTPSKSLISPVLIGVALAPDTRIGTSIQISKIIDKIDLFWDWQPYYKKDIYDISEIAKIIKKFVPMLWGPHMIDKDNDITDYLKQNPLFIFSWNEPDMVGTMMYDNNATSSGFWVSNEFVYGNNIENGITKIQIDNNNYKNLATVLSDECDLIKKYTNLKIATPAMAQSADISNGCAGFKNLSSEETSLGGLSADGKVSQPIGLNACNAISCKICNTDDCIPGACNGIPYVKNNSTSKCTNSCWLSTDNGETKNYNCVCNGWLSLVKAADSGNSWWSKTSIINIHCYNRYAHAVKIHILEYMGIFSADLIQRTYNFSSNVTTVQTQGKEIWLTEVACIYGVNDKPVDTTIQFIIDLLWNDTNISSLPTGYINSKTKDIPETLPGLRTNNKFNFNNTTSSWYEKGLGAVTWFTSKNFPGFPTSNVNKNDYSPSISSNIWTDGNLNNIYKSLIPDTIN